MQASLSDSVESVGRSDHEIKDGYNQVQSIEVQSMLYGMSVGVYQRNSDEDHNTTESQLRRYNFLEPPTRHVSNNHDKDLHDMAQRGNLGAGISTCGARDMIGSECDLTTRPWRGGAISRDCVSQAHGAHNTLSLRGTSLFTYAGLGSQFGATKRHKP